jgi:SET domain-containing protein
MKKPLVHIKKSKTGMGLFAGQDIKKDTKIVEYIGEKIPTSEADILIMNAGRGIVMH